MIAGFILSGLSYENYSEVCHVVDFQTTSNKIYTDIMKIFLKNGTVLLVKMLKINRENAFGSTIVIVTDGAWFYRGWNVNECCVACFDLYGQCLLAIKIVIRKLPGDDYGNYEGASSGMEGERVRRCMNLIEKAGIDVGTVVHNGDGVTLNIVKEFFPNAEELNDGGHASKNFRKTVIKLVTRFTGVKNMGEVCMKAFKHAMINCEKDPKEFRNIM